MSTSTISDVHKQLIRQVYAHCALCLLMLCVLAALAAERDGDALSARPEKHTSKMFTAVKRYMHMSTSASTS